MRFEKTYTINETNSLDLVRKNPSGSMNRGDLAEVSLAEYFGIANHDMHRQEKSSCVEPDLIVNGVRYQVKGLKASMKMLPTIQAYVEQCACDMFALVLKNNKENNYQVYELNKSQMLDMLLEDSLCYNDKSSSKNQKTNQRRMRESFPKYKEWLEA